MVEERDQNEDVAVVVMTTTTKPLVIGGERKIDNNQMTDILAVDEIEEVCCFVCISYDYLAVHFYKISCEGLTYL